MHRLFTGRLAALFLALWAMAGVYRANAASRVLYETKFEANQGFDPALTLVGQGDWVGYGTGGNGLVTDFFPGEGQHAYVGFTPPAAADEFLNVWRPMNFVPGGTNPTFGTGNQNRVFFGRPEIKTIGLSGDLAGSARPNPPRCL